MHAVAEPGQHSIHEGGDVGKDLIVRKAKRLKQIGNAPVLWERKSQIHQNTFSTILAGVGLPLPPKDVYMEFLLAIFCIGLKVASPKVILEKMPNSDVMTVNRIKSHLQKIRQNKPKSYKDFQKLHERLFMGEISTLSYANDTILANEGGSEKGHNVRPNLESTTSPPTTNPPVLDVPMCPIPMCRSFSSTDLNLIRDSLALVGLAPDESSIPPPLELSSSAFKSTSSEARRNLSAAMLDPSSSTGSNSVYPLDTLKTTDGWVPTFPPFSLKHLDQHGYTSEQPMTATSVASRSSRVHDSGYKSATPKRPSIPPDTPDIEVEVSEALQDLFVGLHTKKRRLAP